MNVSIRYPALSPEKQFKVKWISQFKLLGTKFKLILLQNNLYAMLGAYNRAHFMLNQEWAKRAHMTERRENDLNFVYNIF